MSGRSDIEIAECKSVLAVNAGGLRSESGLMQDLIEDVTRLIARKHAAGAVGAVGAGRKPQHQHVRRRIAEGRHGTSPVSLVAVGAPLELRNFRRMTPQSRAAGAAYDLLV